MKLRNILALFAGGLLVATAAKGSENATSLGQIKSILFVGDSNTALPYSYANQVKKLFPYVKVGIVAKIGEQTGWMLTQLKAALQASKYDVVCILGGSNDIYALDSITSTKSNLNRMYDLVLEAGSKLVAVTPPNKDFYVKKTAHKQWLLAELRHFILNNSKPTAVIDFWTITNDKKYFTEKDGYLHAQEPAHKLLLQSLISILIRK